MPIFTLFFPHGNSYQAEKEHNVLLFMQPKFVASFAAFMQISASAQANTAHVNTGAASKRTAWYPAFADQATWSPIG
jgi:hypothetical protein